jgi:hypothetical protein
MATICFNVPKTLKYHRATQSVAQKLYIVRVKGELLLEWAVMMGWVP